MSPIPRMRAHLQWLEQHWADYQETCIDLLPDAIRAAGGGSRGSGHSDPVPNIALADEIGDNGYADNYENLQGALATLEHIVGQVQRVITTEGRIARERHILKSRLITCDGSFDPLCGNEADPHRGGKCASCYWKAYRNLRKATTSLHCNDSRAIDGYDSSELSPVERIPLLVRHANTECPLCGAHFSASGTDDKAIQANVLEQLHEHRVGGCAA